MTPEQWQRIEQLLDDVLDREPGQRAAYLAAVCGDDTPLRAEVEALVGLCEQADCEGFLEAPLLRPRAVPDGPADGSVSHAGQGSASGTASGVGSLAVAAPLPEWPRVPGYEILGELGRGGMGVVYKAQQVSLRRPVALKMILAAEHAGAEAAARFRREAEAAACLQHPNVVQIFEVDDAHRPPFLTMEYVDGPPLDRRLAGVPQAPAQAAAWIETLARAIHYAHERKIIHRDLKPANVLVAHDGTPKITDFGLAKVLAGESQGETGSGDILGTPSYMAPEQAAGGSRGIGPAADVYALGAILYEMLTGRPPFLGATALDTVQQVRDLEPVPPRRVQPGVPRDLDTICLKCLAKEPGQRYASAEALADDLQRFLRGAPIQARPLGLWGRSVKWARRRPAVTALLATLVVVVVGSFVGLTGMWLRTEEQRAAAERQRAVAERQRAVAQTVSDFLQHDLLGQADTGNQPLPAGPAGRNRDIKVRELLDRAAARIEGKFRDQPEVEAAVRWTIGETYRALGAYDQAREQLERAAAWRRQHLGADHPDTLRSLSSLARLYWSLGRYPEAESLLQEVLAGRRRALGADHPHTLNSLNNLAMLYQSLGRYAAAEPLYKEALGVQRRTLSADDHNLLTTANNLAMLYQFLGRYAAAEPLLQEALAGSRRRLGADHPDTLISLSNLAVLYCSLGRYAAAEPLLQEALAGQRRTLGTDHPNTLSSLNSLALLYHSLGRYAAAEPLLQEVLVGQRRTLGAEHPDTLVSLHNLARLHQSRGRYDEAELAFLQAISGARQKLGLKDPRTETFIRNTAGLYEQTGQPEKAEPLWRELVAAAEQHAGPKSPKYAAQLANLGRNLLKQHQPTKAEPLLRTALAIRRDKEPEAWTTFHTQSLLGGALVGQKQYAAAEPLLVQGYEGMKQREATIPADLKIRLREAVGRLVQFYDAWDKPEQAQAWRQQREPATNPTKEPEK